jgi:predicted flavoprotein YhiN
MGFGVDWSAHMARHFGSPVKGAALCVAGRRERGEFVVSQRGLEGGGIYAVARALREGAGLTLDLLPGLTVAQVSARLAQGKAKDTAANRLRKLGLSAVAVALVQEWARPLPEGAALAAAIKALPVPLTGPRPLDEAISVAGGITRASLTGGLELRAVPGVFACGEMLDWEAPTGGYLLTACLATGRWAGRAARR